MAHQKCGHNYAAMSKKYEKQQKKTNTNGQRTLEAIMIAVNNHWWKSGKLLGASSNAVFVPLL